MSDKLIALNDDAQTLITLLHRGGNYSFFQRINGDDKCSYWRRYGKRIEFPVDIVENYNFYFGVNPATMKVTDDDRKKYPDIPADRIATFVGTKNSTIAALNCLYAEFDGKDYTFPADEEIEQIFQALRVQPNKAAANDATLRLEAAGMAKEAKYATNPEYYKALAKEHIESLKPQPSAVVDSGGGYQGYWLAADTFILASDADRERAANLQKRWVMFVCGDPSVHDLRRILRVPGSRNHKKRYAPDYPVIDFIKKDFDLRYTFEELEALLPPEEPKPVPQRTNGAYHTNGEGSFIDMFNATNSIADVLLAHGYTWVSKDRMNRPGSEDSKGVVIYAEDNESYHHSGGDPLHNGYRMKPFNVVCKLDYNDDPREAIRALRPPETKQMNRQQQAPVETIEKPTEVIETPKQPTGDLDLALLAIKSIGETARGLSDEHRKTLLEVLAPLIGNLADDDKRLALDTLHSTYLPTKEDIEWFIDLLPNTSEHYYIKMLRKQGYKFRLNVLEDMVEVDGKRLDDTKRSELYLKAASYKIPKTYVDDAINVLAAENSYHPVKDYLNSLVWNGENHLIKIAEYIKGDGRVITYSNGATYPLHAALMERWFTGCVARAMDGDRDGAFKHQTPMLVFIGKQGVGKSSFVRWLVSKLGYEFHKESPIDPHHPDHIRAMVTKWIWEASELGSSLRKGDRDALKGFITQEWHTYRKPYGRSSITKPTLCNFVGTINPETGFLDDPTGHRRFLPIHITEIVRGYEQAIDIDQLWAQVVHLYRTGFSPELDSLERAALATTYGEHEVENPLQTYLQMYFTIDPEDDELKCFTADIILRLQAFGIQLSNNPKIAGREINDALAPLGASRKKISVKGIKAMGWVGIAPNNTAEPR